MRKYLGLLFRQNERCQRCGGNIIREMDGLSCLLCGRKPQEHIYQSLRGDSDSPKPPTLIKPLPRQSDCQKCTVLSGILRDNFLWHGRC